MNSIRICTTLRFMRDITHPCKLRGFTLPELMMTLAVAGVLVAITVPNMSQFLRNNRLSGATNDLLRSVQNARSQAITRQRTVAVCASANPGQVNANCSNGSFTGWIVFEDANTNWQRDAGELLIEGQVADPVMTVVNDNNGVISFSPTGFRTVTAGQVPTTTILLCDDRGTVAIGNDSVARAVLVDPTGRPRSSKTNVDVQAAVGIVGNCPP
jgi:type IV fimbrial biogenesis protein FimT